LSWKGVWPPRKGSTEGGGVSSGGFGGGVAPGRMLSTRGGGGGKLRRLLGSESRRGEEQDPVFGKGEGVVRWTVGNRKRGAKHNIVPPKVATFKDPNRLRSLKTIIKEEPHSHCGNQHQPMGRERRSKVKVELERMNHSPFGKFWGGGGRKGCPTNRMLAAGLEGGPWKTHQSGLPLQTEATGDLKPARLSRSTGGV